MPLPLASGLKDNWKTKSKADNGRPQDEPVLAGSGLTDEHASSVCPKFDKQKQGTVTEVSICQEHSTHLI